MTVLSIMRLTDLKTDEVMHAAIMNKIADEFKNFYYTHLKALEIEYWGATTDNLTAISAATEVWDGNTTPKVAYVWSDSANDKDLAAGHVRAVEVIGINSNDVKTTEIIRMNATTGLTKSAGTTLWKRVDDFYACEWGTGGSDAAGNISLGFDIISDGDMSSSDDWTEGVGSTVAAGVLTHTTGNATETTQDVVAIGGLDDVNGVFNITWTIVSIADAGTVTPNIANVDFAAKNAPGTFSDEVTGIDADDDFAIVFDAGFGGVIDNVSVARRYLFIAANANESNGSIIYIPDGWYSMLVEAIFAPTAGAKATDDAAIVLKHYEMGRGSDPDFHQISIHVGGGEPDRGCECPKLCTITGAAKEGSIAPFEDGINNTPAIHFHAILLLFKLKSGGLT